MLFEFHTYLPNFMSIWLNLNNTSYTTLYTNFDISFIVVLPYIVYRVQIFLIKKKKRKRGEYYILSKVYQKGEWTDFTNYIS